MENSTKERIYNEKALREFEIEIKMLINRRMLKKGAITEEMYIGAKERILAVRRKGE